MALSGVCVFSPSGCHFMCVFVFLKYPKIRFRDLQQNKLMIIMIRNANDNNIRWLEKYRCNQSGLINQRAVPKDHCNNEKWK